MGPLGVVHVAAEASPYSSSGGLGNVVGSLAPATARHGARVSVISPKYRSVPDSGLSPLPVEITVPVGDAAVPARIWRDQAAKGGVDWLFVDIPQYFDRSAMYGERGEDYPDNISRFVAFCRAAIETVRTLQIPCDLLHAHDWQAALTPLYLKSLYRSDRRVAAARSVLTVHNLAYQGCYEHVDLPLTGLDARYYTTALLEFYDGLNLLKAGILAADVVTTVSPNYAREILTPEFGFGLDGVLRDRASHLHGILNGIDTDEWDPTADSQLPARFSSDRLQGKAHCKQALQRELGLEVSPQRPLFGIVSRLAHQKGIDLLLEALPSLERTGAQWVILGNGAPALESALRELADADPERIAACIDFDNELAHRIFAGADFTLLPSRFEPCGLAQMYAQRYGTIPVVSRVGGLADTVIDLDEHPDTGTGVCFEALTAEGIRTAIGRALPHFRRRRTWPALRRRAMARDFSWDPSVRGYLEVYRTALDRPPTPLPAGL